MRIDPTAGHFMNAAAPGGCARPPWRRLAREVMKLAGDHAVLLHHSEKTWASVTFSGARHTVGLCFTGDGAMDAADDFIMALPEHEFTISGWVVADATIILVDQKVLPEPNVTIEAELLLLEES